MLITLIVASNSPTLAEAVPEKTPTPTGAPQVYTQTEKEKEAAVDAERKKNPGTSADVPRDFVRKFLFQSYGKKHNDKKKVGAPQAASNAQRADADVEGPTLPDAK